MTFSLYVIEHSKIQIMPLKITSHDIHVTNSSENLTPINELVLIVNALKIYRRNCPKTNLGTTLQIHDKFKR